MKPPTAIFSLILLMICPMQPSFAQQQPEGATLTTPAESRAVQPGTLTGKERLGEKWKDEQRIDNCKVPPDKRGARPRSSECPHVPTG
jgi:hypothetical protein